MLALQIELYGQKTFTNGFKAFFSLFRCEKSFQYFQLDPRTFPAYPFASNREHRLPSPSWKFIQNTCHYERIAMPIQEIKSSVGESQRKLRHVPTDCKITYILAKLHIFWEPRETGKIY